MIIYKATNKLNKSAYIGFTHNLATRRYGHVYDASRGSEYGFHRALRKYGEDAFTWEILAECETREEAGEIETQMIKTHNTFKNGYNGTSGGENGWTHSDAAKKKMSKSRQGIVYSKETLQKMSEAKIGKILSEEHKDNISKGNKGRVVTAETRKKISQAKKGIPTNVVTTGAFKKGNVPWNKGIKV